MKGLNRHTGRAIAGVDHEAQSIEDILTTPIGSRVMRRDYGSRLPELIDQPVNGSTRLKIFAATATAIRRWYPRIRLTRVALRPGDRPGHFLLDLVGVRRGVPEPQALFALTLPLRSRGHSAAAV